jgi:hypothetical protein
MLLVLNTIERLEVAVALLLLAVLTLAIRQLKQHSAHVVRLETENRASRERESNLREIETGLQHVVNERAATDAERVQRTLLRERDQDWPVRCLECKFFELEAAQTSMRKNGAFARVMDFMSPYQMGKRVSYKESPCPTCMPGSKVGSGEQCLTCGGERVVRKAVEEYPAGVPMNAKWSEYGWCTNEHVVYEGGVPFTERVLWGGISHCEGKFFQLRLRHRAEQSA